MAGLLIHPGRASAAEDVDADIIDEQIWIFAGELGELVLVVKLAHPVGQTIADVPDPRAAIQIREQSRLMEIVVDRMVVPVQVFEQGLGKADARHKTERLVTWKANPEDAKRLFMSRFQGLRGSIEYGSVATAHHVENGLPNRIGKDQRAVAFDRRLALEEVGTG